MKYSDFLDTVKVLKMLYGRFVGMGYKSGGEYNMILGRVAYQVDKKSGVLSGPTDGEVETLKTFELSREESDMLARAFGEALRDGGFF